MKKPEPIPTLVSCSVCGLSWDAHGEKPTLLDCVELLKAELAKRRMAWSFTNIPTTWTSTSSTIPGLRSPNYC